MGLETDGIDVQINWSASLSDIGADVGDASAEIYVTPVIGWVNHYTIQTLPGSAFQDHVNTSTLGSALPRWKALTTVGYCSDLFGNVRVNDSIELRAGVTNLFDRGLPVVASSQNSTDVAVYGAVGRSDYVGLRAKF